MELTALRIDLAGHYARNGYLVGPLLSPTQMSRIADLSWCYLRSRGVSAPDLTSCRDHCGDRRTRAENEDAGYGVAPQERPQPAAPITFGDIVGQMPAAAEVAIHADTLDLAAHIIGAPSVRLLQSALLFQPAHSVPPPYGDDDRASVNGAAGGLAMAADPALEPDLGVDLRAIIAVDDQFDDGGGLHLIPGSHHPISRRTRSDTEYSVPLPAGWVAMLHPRLRYWRAGNSSHVPRRCLVLDYAATVGGTAGAGEGSAAPTRRGGL